jgi:hypothetical protein
VFKYGNCNLGILEAIRIAYKRPTTRVDKSRDTFGREVIKVIEGFEFYCRVITDVTDVQMTSPDGKDWALLGTPVNHDLGYCPWVWIRNEPVLNEVDGKPDFDEQWDNLEQLDYILSQGSVGVRVNCDPTLVLKMDGDGTVVGTGSMTAIVLSPDPTRQEDAKLLETTGKGGEIALAYAAAVESSILEDTRIVLDEGKAQNSPQRTATELVKRTQAMYEHAADLRQVYGPAAEKLMEMLLTIIRKYGVADLPEAFADLDLPASDDVDLEWSSMVQVSATEQAQMVTTFAMAIDKGILSRQTARTRLASTLGITDVEAEAQLVEAERQLYAPTNAPAPGNTEAASTSSAPQGAGAGAPGNSKEVPGTSGATFQPPVEGVWRDFPGVIQFLIVDGLYITSHPECLNQAVQDPGKGPEPFASDDFIQGMNWARCPQLPVGVAWLDDRVVVTDHVYTAIHETVETAQMLLGKSYDDAHSSYANPKETYAREHPEQAEAILQAAVEDLRWVREQLGV